MKENVPISALVRLRSDRIASGINGGKANHERLFDWVSNQRDFETVQANTHKATRKPSHDKWKLTL